MTRHTATPARSTVSQPDTPEEVWDVVVIGGGPAGMMAAGRAAERGRRVLLLEKNRRLGEKLLITGGGRCNVTNATADRHALTQRYGEHGKHLHSIFARFSPDDMRAFLRRYGLETRIEAENRVFPVTDSAASVRKVLQRYMSDGGVTVRTAVPIAGFETTGQGTSISGVRTERDEVVRGNHYILAVGGTSRPETGSTGDGFRWLAELGQPIRHGESSLVPIVVPDRWVHSLQGVSLDDACLHVESLPAGEQTHASVRDRSAWGNAKRVLSQRGKLLFTHFGLSGPLALNAAESVNDLAQDAPIRLLIDLRPGDDHEVLDGEIRAAAESNGRRTVNRVLTGIVPKALAKPLCEVAGADPEQRIATLGRTTRKRLVETIKAMPCSFAGLMGSDKAVVSSGGLHPASVDFRTMKLRDFPELAVLGDMLDFNRRSGGYSLQICWAGGWVAGEACADAKAAQRS